MKQDAIRAVIPVAGIGKRTTFAGTMATGLIAVAALGLVTVACSSTPSRPFDPDTLEATSPGTVIPGICPAEAEPPTVTSESQTSDLVAKFIVNGTAYPGLTVLSWDAPDIDELQGFRVARMSYEPRHRLEQDSLRLFNIEPLTDGGELPNEFVDTESIEAGKFYYYRVFPVTSYGLAYPSRPISVWTPQSRSPFAPTGGSTRVLSDGQLEVSSWSGFQIWELGQRVARRQLGDTEWQIVFDEPPPTGYADSFSNSWTDEDVEPGIRYQYAVCHSNLRGYCPAILLTSQGGNSVIDIAPPRNLRVLDTPGRLTVTWDPVNDARVTGYEAVQQREGMPEEYPHRAAQSTNQGAENYVTFWHHSDEYAVPVHYKVRAKSRAGLSPWSEALVVDNDYAQAVKGSGQLAEILSVNAFHDRVHLVWIADFSTDSEDERVRYRLLRRVADSGDRFQARAAWGEPWLDAEYPEWVATWPAQFDGEVDKWNGVFGTGITDDFRVRPGTEYEYAVQLKRGDQLMPPSTPI